MAITRGASKNHFVLVFVSSLGLALVCFAGSFFLSLQRDPTPMMKEFGPGLMYIFKYICVGIVGLLGCKWHQVDTTFLEDSHGSCCGDRT